MSNKSKRNSQIPPRPQLINEQMRREINAHIGNKPRVLDRRECIEFAAMVAANLEKLLNNRTQLPWVTASIDKRSDGFDLHVNVVHPTDEVDVRVVQ